MISSPPRRHHCSRNFRRPRHPPYCKAAVKAGMVLTFKEIDTLLQELFSLPNPYTCPHGRPTTIKYTQEELEKLKGKNL